MGLCSSAANKFKTVLHTGSDPKNPGKPYATVPSSHLAVGKILVSRNVKNFCFRELTEATKNFSPGCLLGIGAFGFVYKAWIDNHSLKAARPETGMPIAVKVLDQKGCQGQQEWLAEIKFLGQLSHPNLVKLIGYCSEHDHRFLVYEFMPNGSLDKHLFVRTVDFVGAEDYHIRPLSWNLRIRIALGAAKGLAFLHDEPQVIYRDFKTSNILLDSNYNAKLSDFGLAKDGPTGDKSHLTVSISGTYGYLAPEYTNAGRLSTKSDVYSFGVVLLELISGRPAIDKYRQSMEQNLVEWAMPYLGSKRRVFRVFDSCIEGKYALIGALRAANLAFRCLSTVPSNRPNMKEVVNTLEQITSGKN